MTTTCSSGWWRLTSAKGLFSRGMYLRGTDGEMEARPMGRCLMSLIKKLNTFFGTKIGPGHLDISLWLFAGLQHSLISQDEAAWTTMTY